MDRKPCNKERVGPGYFGSPDDRPAVGAPDLEVRTRDACEVESVAGAGYLQRPTTGDRNARDRPPVETDGQGESPSTGKADWRSFCRSGERPPDNDHRAGVAHAGCVF